MSTPSTLAQIRAKIRRDLDLQDEDFITDTELNDYINDGIRECEAELAGLSPETHPYFLTEKSISLVAGQRDYKLPENIYATKVRAIVYDNGVDSFKIKPIPAFEDVPYFEQITSNNRDFSYILMQEPKGVRLRLFPTPTANESEVVSVWYVRNMAQLVNDSDEHEIPEFINFVMQYAKVECLRKEGHPNLGTHEARLQRDRELMVNTLASRVVDGETEIAPDTRLYDDMMEQ